MIMMISTTPRREYFARTGLLKLAGRIKVHASKVTKKTITKLKAGYCHASMENGCGRSSEHSSTEGEAEKAGDEGLRSNV